MRHGLGTKNILVPFAPALPVIRAGLFDTGQIFRAGGGQQVLDKIFPFFRAKAFSNPPAACFYAQRRCRSFSKACLSPVVSSFTGSC
jgi:hypothetical protein